MTTLLTLVLLVAEGPEAKEIKAGWLAFGLFLVGAFAVLLLWLSMRKQMRRVNEAKASGVFGDEPETTAPDDEG